MIDGVPLPTLSAAFVVKANEPGTFASGTLLEGVLFVEDHNCPLGCPEIPLEFAAEIP